MTQFLTTLFNLFKVMRTSKITTPLDTYISSHRPQSTYDIEYLERKYARQTQSLTSWS